MILAIKSVKNISFSPIRRENSIAKFTIILTFMLLLLIGCQRSTPPGPRSVAGTVGQAGYVLVDWQEGLRIMIWNDIPHGSMGTSGTGSTSDPVFHFSGNVASLDGRGYDFTLETTDGLQADFSIDDIPYDLDRGKLFLVRTAGSDIQVDQRNLDIPDFEQVFEEIEAFGRTTPEIAALIAGLTADVGESGDCPPGTDDAEPPPLNPPQPGSISHSLKGYAVKSYCQNGEWTFTFTVGLNRVQPCEYPDPSLAEDGLSYTVKGIEALVEIMNQLPPEEAVIWCPIE